MRVVNRTTRGTRKKTLEISEQSSAIQILRPVRAVPDVRAEIEGLIEKKISEIIGADETGIFEPFFQTKLIAREIRKLQTIPQRLKWTNYFKEWGCLSCCKKEGQYGGEGMCGTCYQRTKARVRTILRFTEKERPDALLGCPAESAVAAVRTRPSSDLPWQLAPKSSSTDEEDALLAAAGIPPLEVETRPYVTRAERTARRAETLHQAKALRFEKGLTWREIAQRLDPDFDKNPKAAIARIKMGAHRVSLVRDLTNLARTVVRNS